MDRAAIEKMSGIVKYRRVPGGQNVAGSRQWQPKVIVRTMRAYATPRRRMPPMLDVAFDELTTRTENDLRAHEVRFGVHQSHHVLQLVAETVRAARLVVAAACPKTARHRLVHKPAVGQHVECHVRRLHLHGG